MTSLSTRFHSSKSGSYACAKPTNTLVKSSTISDLLSKLGRCPVSISSHHPTMQPSAQPILPPVSRYFISLFSPECQAMLSLRQLNIMLLYMLHMNMKNELLMGTTRNWQLGMSRRGLSHLTKV